MMSEKNDDGTKSKDPLNDTQVILLDHRKSKEELQKAREDVDRKMSDLKRKFQHCKDVLETKRLETKRRV